MTVHLVEPWTLLKAHRCYAPTSQKNVQTRIPPRNVLGTLQGFYTLQSQQDVNTWFGPRFRLHVFRCFNDSSTPSKVGLYQRETGQGGERFIIPTIQWCSLPIAEHQAPHIHLNLSSRCCLVNYILNLTPAMPFTMTKESPGLAEWHLMPLQLTEAASQQGCARAHSRKQGAPGITLMPDYSLDGLLFLVGDSSLFR